MTLTWENLQERRRKWRESKTGWRDKMREAQEQRRLEQIYFHRSTPWTRDEHGNLSRQVGDVGG